MASTIDELLSRALLHDTPDAPTDITDAADTTGAAGTAEAEDTPGQQDMRRAARDLKALCETAVTGTAVSSLGDDFLTQALPQPSGARVLGCILLLTDAEDSARFWWQYAAGAGDSIASYCLYLHHLALGENRQAVWWRRQTAPAAAGPGPAARAQDAEAAPTVVFAGPGRNLAADASLPTTLRVLRALRALRPGGSGRRRGSATVDAVMEYVPAAVRYVDEDLELPLPEPDFSERIRSITAAAARPRPPRRRTRPALPARHPET